VITQEENKEYPVMSKTDAADVILNEIIKRNERN
jgi:hypothetical protein